MYNQDYSNNELYDDHLRYFQRNVQDDRDANIMTEDKIKAYMAKKNPPIKEPRYEKPTINKEKMQSPIIELNSEDVVWVFLMVIIAIIVMNVYVISNMMMIKSEISNIKTQLDKV